jgi:hypothetical protein
MPPTTSLSATSVTEDRTPRRAAWRQRLVEAERGISRGLRGDGTLYVYLFFNCLAIAIGVVLRLSTWQWIVVGLVVTLVLSAELMCQALRVLTAELQRTVPECRLTPVLHLATAAVTAALLGGSAVVAAIFWQRIRDLYGL